MGRLVFCALAIVGCGGNSGTDSDAALTTDAATNVLPLSGTLTAAAFETAVEGAPSGPLVVEPAGGHTTFTVTGDVELTRASVSIRRATFTDSITFANTSSGSSLFDSKLVAAHIRGADDVTWERNEFDSKCLVAQNFIMDEPAGVVPERFRIVDNTFRNYHYCADESVHSEALYIGYSDGGLIESNLFEDNGTTAHVFFTWWGATADPSISWARNICVRGNTFRRAINPYFSIQIRGEIAASSNISADPNNVTDRSLMGNSDGESTDFIRTCP